VHSKNDSELQKLEETKYSWSPLTPKLEGTRPVGPMHRVAEPVGPRHALAASLLLLVGLFAYESRDTRDPPTEGLWTDGRIYHARRCFTACV